LKVKNTKSIKKVLGIGTLIASASYILAGVFGYITFSKRINVD